MIFRGIVVTTSKVTTQRWVALGLAAFDLMVA
jgi:hypothetical protein